MLPDTIDIYFTFSDQEGDSMSVGAIDFSVDSATWITRSMNSVVGNTTFAPGSHSVRWLSGEALDGLDTTVFLRMGMGSVAGASVEDFETGDLGRFAWELGGDASWSVTSEEAMQGVYSVRSGSITHNGQCWIEVTLDVDSAGEISFYQRTSTEGGCDYLRFSINGSELGYWSGDGSWTRESYSVEAGENTFRWRYTKDGSVDSYNDYVLVDSIVFPSSSAGGNAASNYVFTQGYRVDFNDPPSCTVSPVSGTQAGDVDVSFTLSDTEEDVLSLTAQYYDESGGSWEDASVTGQMSAIDTSGYSGSITWNSVADIPEEQGSVGFRIVPSDKDAGVPDSVEILVSNYGIPSVTVDALSGEQADSVTVSYTLVDANSSTLGIVVRFSNDNGATWSDASVVGDTTGIGPSAYSGSIIWLSGEDLPGWEDSAIVKITPSDVVVGGSGQTGNFYLDNNLPPAMSSITVPQSTAVGVVTLQCRLTDADDTLASGLSVVAEYSVDSGTTWQAASMDTLSSITYSGKDSSGTGWFDGVLVWRSQDDMPDTSCTTVVFRVTPLDRDTGESLTSSVFALDNTGDLLTNKIDYVRLSNDTAFIYFSVNDTSFDMDAVETYLSDAYYDLDYSTNDTVSWNTVYNVSYSTYDAVLLSSVGRTGCIAWSNLGTYVGTYAKVYVRLMVTDGQESEELVSDPFYVDLDDDPSLKVSSYSPQDMVSAVTAREIVFTLNDEAKLYGSDGVVVEGLTSGTLSLTSETALYYTETEITATLDVCPIAGDTLAVRLRADGVRKYDMSNSTYGSGLDGNGNETSEGSPTDDYTWTFAVAYLGDFNLDGTVDFSDVSYVSRCWYNSVTGYNTFNGYPDSTSEIGPAYGTIPNLRLVPDGFFTFEDLTTFVRMWHWCNSNGGMAKVSGALARSIEVELQQGRQSVGSLTQILGAYVTRNQDLTVQKVAIGRQNDRVAVGLKVDGVSDLIACRYIVQYDPSRFALDEASAGGMLAQNEGSVLLLTSEETGAVEMNLARFSSESYAVSGDGQVGQVVLAARDNMKSTVRVGYELVDGNHKTVESGLIEVEVPGFEDEDALPLSNPLLVGPNPSSPSGRCGVFELSDNPGAFDWVRSDQAGVMIQFGLGALLDDANVSGEISVEAYLKIYNRGGQLVAYTQKRDLGEIVAQGEREHVFSVYWPGCDEQGRRVRPGVYRVVLYYKNRGGGGKLVGTIGME